MKAVFVVLAATILVGGCFGDKPVSPTVQTKSEEEHKRDCADPKWREQNLGLWYSVCRRPLRW